MRKVAGSLPIGREPLLFVVDVKPLEEVIIGALVNFPQFDEDTGADIQFPGFVLGIGSPTNIAPSALQFGTQLFLR
jgi:hypothetical protein